jgi:hypothetical protein
VLGTANVQHHVVGLLVAEEQGARDLKGVPEPVGRLKDDDEKVRQ